MSSNTPSVSIICPVYQAEAYLRRCVDSILAQRFTDFELLLVDDGSRDTSGAICDEYAQKDSRVRVLHKENGGVCSARNRGIDEAQGEYTIHADPDDWVEPDFLEELYRAAKASDADMVLCDFFQNVGNEQYYIKQEPSGLDHQTLLNDLFNGLHGSCWNKLVRRASYQERNLRFPENLTIWEDLYFNATLCMEEIKIAYVAKALYHYDFSINANSLVRMGNQRTVDSQKWVIDSFERRLGSSSQLDELKIMTKERAFFTRPQTGKQIVSLYSEVNEKYLDRKNYKHPVWRALSTSLRFPLLYPLVERFLAFELIVRQGVHYLVNKIKGR